MAIRRIGRSMTGMDCVLKSLIVTTCRPALVAIVVAGLALSSAACGVTGSAATANDRRAHALADARPRVLSVRYGLSRPAAELHAYTALVIKARDADGQIVSVAYQQLDAAIAAIADSPCGLGGKRAGQIETFTLPINLRSGSHRFLVTVRSSPCGKAGRPESASRTFTLLAR